MGAGSRLLMAIGLFPWSIVSLLFRAVVPANLGPVIYATAAVLFVAGAATTTRRWLQRQDLAALGVPVYE